MQRKHVTDAMTRFELAKEQTHSAAMSIIGDETAAREAKVDRLRAARKARDDAEAAQPEAPSAKKRR